MSKNCQKPDVDQPNITCGYPLPCPHHTYVADPTESPREVTIPPVSQAQAAAKTLGELKLLDEVLDTLEDSYE